VVLYNRNNYFSGEYKIENGKKYRIAIVGLLAFVIFGVTALIAMTSGGDQRASLTCQDVKSCSTQVCSNSCTCLTKEDGKCPADCSKECCTAKNAEEKVESCSLSSPKSCCNKN